jgi:hypothetical protein
MHHRRARPTSILYLGGPQDWLGVVFLFCSAPTPRPLHGPTTRLDLCHLARLSFPRDNTLRHGRSSDLDFLCCLSDMLSVKWTVRKSTLDIFLGRTLARFLPACAASHSFESSPSETPSIELRRRSKLCSSFAYFRFVERFRELQLDLLC